MEPTEDYIVALNAIEIDPNMTQDELTQMIKAQVRDLIKRYKTGQPQNTDN